MQSTDTTLGLSFPHAHQAQARRRPVSAFAVDFDGPALPHGVEVTGNIFGMLGRLNLSSLHSNVQHLATTLSGHSPSMVADALCNQPTHVSYSQHEPALNVRIGTNRSSIARTLQLRGQAYISRGWAASHLQNDGQAQHASSADVNLPLLDREETGASLAYLFEDHAQPELHSTDSHAQQLVTVVITIHDDALQQALSQAQRDLHDARAKTSHLQTQADTLRAELQQAASASASTTASAAAADHSHNMPTASTADPADSSHDVSQLQEQLQCALQQAESAAALHATAVETLNDLQKQVIQHGSSLAEEQRANQVLKTKLQAAEAAVAQSSGTVQLLRVEALAAEQQLRAAQSEAGHGSAVRAQLQSELSAVEAQRQQSQAQLLQAEQLVQQLQELVEQLRTELADARQETSIASEALTASTELAGRLQAHVEIAQEQGAAAVQRVTHEHNRAIADLEHRLQQATAALQRSTASAAAADAQQHGSIQALQQRLEAALAQSKTATSKNKELASTLAQLEAQLDSAQSSMAIQSAASEETAAQMQAQVDALHLQLTIAYQAAAGAADTEAVVGAAAAEGGIAGHQAAAQHAEEVCDLQEKLEAAEAVLQQQLAEADDAASEADRRQVVQALQQQLAEAAEQVLVAQGQVFDSASTIAELKLQLVAAQDALHQKSESSNNALQKLQSQVGTLQQQLADAEQAAATSAVNAASLLQRSKAAEASCLQSEAARQQQSVQQTQIVQSLQARLYDAQAALQQSAQTAAHTDTQRQHSIQDLQQQLAIALEQESISQGRQSQLKQECHSLADDLAAAQAAVLKKQQQHQVGVCELQSQVADLQQQIAAAKQAADASAGAAASAERRAASAEASAWEAANQLQAAAVEKDQLRLDLGQQSQTAQSALQERLSSSATAVAQGKQEVNSLQQKLDVATQESNVSQAANADLSASVSQLEDQLQGAQTALTSQSDSNAAAASQAQGQVDMLEQQLDDVRQEAEAAAAQAASLQQAVRTAEQNHQASAALLQQIVTDKTEAANDLEKRLSATQVALQQASNLAAAEAATQQQVVDDLQSKLNVSVEHSTASQALNNQLADAVQQLRIQLQYGKNAMAKQVEANEQAVICLHSQVETLQQRLESVSQEAAAAAEEAVVVRAAAAAAAASHQAAAAVLQESVDEKDAVIVSLQSSLQAAQIELQQATTSAEASQAMGQQSMHLLQQRLHEAHNQSQVLSSSNVQLSASVSHLTQQLNAASAAAVEKAETSSKAMAELQTRADCLHKQLDNALEAADAAAADAAAAGASAQAAAAVLQQKVAARDMECHALEQRLRSTQADLGRAANAAAYTDAQRQQETQSLQTELEAAVAQASTSEAFSIESADRVQQLQTQLESAQCVQDEQSAASSAQITQLHQQVRDLQQQLTEAAEVAAAEVAILTEQATAAEASHLAAAAALQQRADNQTHLVHSLTQELQAAHVQLQQATASAAATHQEDERSLNALQQSLQYACEGSIRLQSDNSELASRLAQAKSELESVQATLASQAAASLNSLAQLQSQLQGLHAQLAAAKRAADAQTGADREHTTDRDAQESLSGQAVGEAADQQGATSGSAASSASQTADQIAAAEVLRLQLLRLSQEMVNLQRAVHAAQLDQAAAQQSEAMMSSHSDSLQVQVNQLQQDVARFERQAVGAQQSSDSWQQTAHHLRAELVDKEKHTAEEDGMHAEVLVLKQEIDQLRETVQRLRQDTPPSPPQSPAPQHAVDALSIADAAYPTLAQKRSQAVASPSTPSHSPWIHASASSMGSSHTNASGERGLSVFSGSRALAFEAEGKGGQFEGGIQAALDPLLLEAANVMTNPMFGMDGQGMSVPATPTAPAPRLLQAVASQQAGHDRLASVEQQLQRALERLAITRSQLSEAEEQGSALMEQQEGAEELVLALRQELHNLRQDTNSVAANARQTVSEKEALQATLGAAQEAMMTQAEVMRQVTAERDMLRERLLQQTLPLARSSTASADWIAAAYGTNSRPAQPLSGAVSLPKKVQHRSSVSSNNSQSSSPRHIQNRSNVSSNTSESSSPRRKWVL